MASSAGEGFSPRRAWRFHQPVRRSLFVTFQLRVSESPARARVWLTGDVVAPALLGGPTERVEVLRSMIGGLAVNHGFIGHRSQRLNDVLFSRWPSAAPAVELTASS